MNTPTPEASREQLPRPDQLRVVEPVSKYRFPIAILLVAGFGGLVALAVASVLYLGLVNAGRNTFELIHLYADARLDTIETHLRDVLEPSQKIAVGVSEAIESGRIDVTDRRQLRDVLRGVVTGSPQISGAFFSTADYQAVIVSRRESGDFEEIDVDMSGDAAVADTQKRVAKGAGWGSIIWQPDLQQPLLPFAAPVRNGDDIIGMVGVYVELRRIVGFVTDLSLEGQEAPVFVLHGQSHVLAHPAMKGTDWVDGLEKGIPLPTLATLNDPVLAMLARGDVEEDRPFDRLHPSLATSRVLSLPKDRQPDYILITREIAGYGPTGWTLVQQFRREDVEEPTIRLVRTAAVGLTILFVSVGLALWFGRRMTRRIEQLADAAESLRTLDFAHAPDVPDSRLRELANAGHAFNAMMVALRWFEMYVPKSLVLRLMQSGDAEVIATRERQVTVMFTDIRGFGALSQKLSASQVADLLNEHFDLLSRAIEAEGGTVDKFIGDSVMAFWGAPDEQPDHATRAIRAAKAIRAAISDDNRRRKARDDAPIQVRIGINSGPAVVGNIGSSSRVNYTLIGDTVNVAERLERLAAELQEEEDVVVMASAATAAAVTGERLEPLGAKSLRGLTGTVEVFRLK